MGLIIMRAWGLRGLLLGTCAAMTVAGGAAGFLDIVVRLLKATFVAPEANPGNG